MRGRRVAVNYDRIAFEIAMGTFPLTCIHW